MDAALATEALKLRRSPVARTGWLAVVLGVPALTAAARAGGDSQLAVKAAAMLTGTGLAGYLGVVGQVTTVAMLVTTGIVTAWCSAANSSTAPSPDSSRPRCPGAGSRPRNSSS